MCVALSFNGFFLIVAKVFFTHLLTLVSCVAATPFAHAILDFASATVHSEPLLGCGPNVSAFANIGDGQNSEGGFVLDFESGLVTHHQRDVGGVRPSHVRYRDGAGPDDASASSSAGMLFFLKFHAAPLCNSIACHL